jgi:hypothetical protein
VFSASLASVGTSENCGKHMRLRPRADKTADKHREHRAASLLQLAPHADFGAFHSGSTAAKLLIAGAGRSRTPVLRPAFASSSSFSRALGDLDENAQIQTQLPELLNLPSERAPQQHPEL